MNTFFLSLGSNISPRKKHLEQAISLLKEQLGNVICISSYYETPAWGFSSTPFLNLCLQIETETTTIEILSITQKIEKLVGRTPKTKTGYEARVVDIDIIYSSEGIFNYDNLITPHPLMQERKFVLIPLAEIAPNIIHPLLHKTTLELIEASNDDSQIERI